jgi:hypothetical protein
MTIRSDAPEVAPSIDSMNTELPTQQNGTGTIESGGNGSADDTNDHDDVTVIVLEVGDDDGEMIGSGWIDQNSPEIQQRRRNVLLRELQRIQRASFIHFMILCLIPTSLLFIVIATVLGEDEECESAATSCEKEPRTFISKFYVWEISVFFCVRTGCIWLDTAIWIEWSRHLTLFPCHIDAFTTRCICDAITVKRAEP